MFDDQLQEEVSKIFFEFIDDCTKREDEVWNSLDYDTKLDVFCAICRRLYEGELIEDRSYRGVLYGKFKFDMDSYMRAQFSGFLELHNSIYNKQRLIDIIEKFATTYDVNCDKADISKFIESNHL